MSSRTFQAGGYEWIVGVTVETRDRHAKLGISPHDIVDFARDGGSSHRGKALYILIGFLYEQILDYGLTADDWERIFDEEMDVSTAAAAVQAALLLDMDCGEGEAPATSDQWSKA